MVLIIHEDLQHESIVRSRLYSNMFRRRSLPPEKLAAENDCSHGPSPSQSTNESEMFFFSSSMIVKFYNLVDDN